MGCARVVGSSGGGVAVIVAAYQWALRPLWRKRQDAIWEKWIEDARVHVGAVQNMRMWAAVEHSYSFGFTGIMNKRFEYLVNELGCSWDLAERDHKIRSWYISLNMARVEKKKWFSKVEDGYSGNARFDVDYVQGRIFSKWEREMSRKFWKKYKGDIEVVRKMAEIPFDPKVTGLYPVDKDPRQPEAVQVRWGEEYGSDTKSYKDDHCVEFFVNDVVVGFWIDYGEIMTEAVIEGKTYTIPRKCPTGKHYKGRKWESPGVGVHG